MSNPYLELFAAPGAKGFSAAGLLARMPLSMTGLGIVTMLSQVHADYWLAGTVAATFVFCNALLAPQVSRLVDRFGQGRVLLPAALASALAMSALLLCTHYRAPNAWLYLFALLAGAMPSMPAMVRARWTELYRGSPKLHTAFSFESVMDEVCYIIGPVLAVSLSVGWFAEAGPLLATLFLVAGVSLFSLQRGTEPPLHAHPRRRAGSALAYPAVRVLALVLAAIGVIFGAVEVVSVAFAEAHGNKAAATSPGWASAWPWARRWPVGWWRATAPPAVSSSRSAPAGWPGCWPWPASGCWLRTRPETARCPAEPGRRIRVRPGRSAR